jgi:hypothetical protein
MDMIVSTTIQLEEEYKLLLVKNLKGGTYDVKKDYKLLTEQEDNDNS